LLRARPDAVLTTGPAVAVPVCLMARLLGVSVVFVETGSRIHGLSSTGRFMRRIASLYFVQWEDLRPLVPRAIFAGRLC
jgi:UDP-N-acetylglucosamine:LPS N-acetylglucosamine transferase